MLQLAVRILGRLALVEGGHTPAETELKIALDRLKHSVKLESAVLVVQELACHAPTLIYVHVHEVSYWSLKCNNMLLYGHENLAHLS